MISVPIAQSILLRPVIGGLPTFYNTFDGIETSREKTIIPWRQYVGLDSIPIQMSVPDDNEQHPVLYILHDNTETVISEVSYSTIADRMYYTFIIPMADYENKLCRLKAVQVFNESDPIFTHLSEPFEIKVKPSYLKLEWHNSENAFLMDYSVSTLVHQMYVDGELEPVPSSGEITVYSNQDIMEKLEETSFRTYSLSLIVPAYIKEQLELALSHDHFYVNEVELFSEKKLSSTRLGNSNLYKVDVELMESVSIGINTHDIG